MVDQPCRAELPRGISAAHDLAALRDSFESAANYLAEQMAPMRAAISEIVRALEPVAAEWTRRLAELAPAIEEANRFAKSAPRRARKAFLAAGYPPTGHLSLGELRRIVEAHESGSHELLLATVAGAIDDITESRTGRALLRARWARAKVISKSRLRILRQALNAHRLALYAVSVPAMIAQTEGLLAEAFAHKGRMGGKELRVYLKRAARADSLLGKVLEAFASEVLLAGFEHGSPVPSALSRHAILHGADTSYASRENSAKAILLFDHVLELVEFRRDRKRGRARRRQPRRG